MRGDEQTLTTATVSARTSLEARPFTAMTNEDIAHLADVMVKVWLRSNVYGWLFVLGPLVGCTAFSVTLPGHIDTTLSVGFFSFLIGNFVNAIASRLSLRVLDLEMEWLGFDRAARRAARKAYGKALREKTFNLGVPRKRAACRAALETLRSRGP